MYDTRFTAASFGEDRGEPYHTVIRFTEESVAKGLRELSHSVEIGETLVDKITSTDEVNGYEFTRTRLEFTYVQGDFGKSKADRLKYLKKESLEDWWDRVGRFKFRRG
jgi:hypothetical protein